MNHVCPHCGLHTLVRLADNDEVAEWKCTNQYCEYYFTDLFIELFDKQAISINSCLQAKGFDKGVMHPFK